MTPQEQELLMSLTQRVNQTQLQEKDRDAENLLGRELGANPDAIYILAQTVLVQNFAIDQAKAQIAQLQQQLQEAKQETSHPTSFMGGLFGRHDSAPQQQSPQPPPYQPVQPYPPVQPYQPPMQQGYYPPQQPQYIPGPLSGQPSFLRGAMTTAAGVAAGALAFEWIESLLHGFGHGGYGSGMAGFGMGPGSGLGGGFGRPVEETVVNNYYAGSGPGSHDRDDGTLRGFDGGGDQGLRESGEHFSDASYETQDARESGGSDTGGEDLAEDSAAYDSSADDVQIDDGGGMDDGGGYDDNNGF